MCSASMGFLNSDCTGMKSHNANHPCRRCTLHRSSFSVTPEISQGSIRTREKMLEAYKLLQKKQDEGSTNTIQMEIAQGFGLLWPDYVHIICISENISKEQSQLYSSSLPTQCPLLHIPDYDPYMSSPYCGMHNVFLGLAVKLVEWTIQPFTTQELDKVDEAIKSFPRPPGWKSLFHSIHRYGNWYAEETRTFCRMALYIWRMYLDAESLILPVW